MSRKEGVGKRFFESRLSGWVLILVLLALWEIVGRSGSPMLPPLSRIFSLWVNDMGSGMLRKATLQTLYTVLVGFAIASVIGGTFGFLMGRFRAVWGLLEPIVEWLRLTPVTAVIPLVVFFLGIGFKVHVFIVAFAATFPVLLNATAGARAVPKAQEETAKTFQLGWFRMLVLIAAPNALPFILVGLRQALGVSLLLSVVAGILAGQGGIGYYILIAQTNFDNTRLFAGLISAFALGYGLNALFLLIEKWLAKA